jgi:hypothetical protein
MTLIKRNIDIDIDARKQEATFQEKDTFLLIIDDNKLKSVVLDKLPIFRNTSEIFNLTVLSNEINIKSELIGNNFVSLQYTPKSNKNYIDLVYSYKQNNISTIVDNTISLKDVSLFNSDEYQTNVNLNVHNLPQGVTIKDVRLPDSNKKTRTLPLRLKTTQDTYAVSFDNVRFNDNNNNPPTQNEPTSKLEKNFLKPKDTISITANSKQPSSISSPSIIEYIITLIFLAILCLVFTNNCLCKKY